jgi:cell division protein ZapE
VLTPDEAQQRALPVLDRIVDDLAAEARPGLFSLLGRREPVRGAYLVGDVGRGKTMLMDLFYAAAPEGKRRVHYHEFMTEVHEAITAFRRKAKGRKESADPIAAVVKPIVKSIRLLCLDEFHVHDITNAMLLQRLFEQLFAGGVTLVATSNVVPERLYENGLNRQLFLPFIDLIRANMEIIELKSQKDFRLDKLSGAELYFHPADTAAKAALDAHWNRLTGRHPGKAQTLDVKGRKLVVPLASVGVARFAFDELCDRPLGANDYLHIAHAFHTVIIDDIPILTPDRRDVARRFINLIDALYDSRICLIASAAAEPDALYPEGNGSDLFERTSSRLTEMRSEAYLAGHSGGRTRR